MKTIGLSASCNAPTDQSSPTASIWAPVRLSGRWSAAIVPATLKISPATVTIVISARGSPRSAVTTR